MAKLILLFTLMLSNFIVHAQDLKFGFIAGMNMNKLSGPVEKDNQGLNLESYDWNTGFMVGATFTWMPSELMGLKGEFVFTQRGSKRAFEGPSYYWFTNTSGTRISTTGTRRIDIDISNAYISLPIMGYIKPLRWIEFHGGANIGFLISSSAFGELFYEGKTTGGVSIQKFSHEIDANYFGDFPLKMSFASPAASVQIGTEKVLIPQSAGAYFEFPEDRGKLYRVPEIGVLGGISIYFNKSLYLSLRANKGLTDVTKSKADVSLQQLDADKKFISRSDSDNNLTFHAAIGFSL
jgi:hypothetical protein